MKQILTLLLFLCACTAYPIINEAIKLNQQSQEKSLIAYDCSSRDGQLTGISLLNDDDCFQSELSSTKSYIQGQLLYKKKFEFLPYDACYVHIQIQIEACGGFFHHPAQKPDQQRFVYLNWDLCEQIINDKTYKDEHYPQINIKLDQNGIGYAEGVLLAGELFNDRRCHGGDFINFDGVIETNVKVFATVTVRTHKGVANFKLADQSVHFNDGHSAKLSDKKFFHPTMGFVYWEEDIPHTQCEKNQLFVLYEGDMTKNFDILWGNRTRTTYSYKDDSVDFFVIPTGEVIICGEKGFKTQISNLFLIDSNNAMFRKKMEKINYKNMIPKKSKILKILKYNNQKTMIIF